jgi:integrase
MIVCDTETGTKVGGRSVANQDTLDNQDTFQDWFDSWMLQRTVNEGRMQADQARFRKYLQEDFGSMPLARVNRPKIESHVKALLDRGVGPFTVDTVLGVLRGVLGFGVETGELKQNAAWGLAVDQAPANRKIELSDTLTDEQVDALRNAINPVYRSLITLAVDLGLTWSECLGLRVDDVDFQTNTLTCGKINAIETNGAVRYEYADGGSSRLLNNEQAKELAHHIVLTQTYREKATEPWLFLTAMGTHPLRPNFNKFFLRPALESAGMDPRSMTFHTLRHTAARRMLDRGMTLEDLQRVLGHSTLATTKNYYGNLVPKKQ